MKCIEYRVASNFHLDFSNTLRYLSVQMSAICQARVGSEWAQRYYDD